MVYSCKLPATRMSNNCKLLRPNLAMSKSEWEDKYSFGNVGPRINIYLFFVTSGTLTLDGTVFLDCGSQHTFTCSVTVAATWTISGLSGISVTGHSGRGIANNNPRITTTDTSGITQSSTITITGFTTADNGGTVQCIELNDGRVQGMASISVGERSCGVQRVCI